MSSVLLFLFEPTGTIYKVIFFILKFNYISILHKCCLCNKLFSKELKIFNILPKQSVLKH